MSMRALARGLAATVAAAGTVALGLTGSAAQAADPVQYVALGDSYSAGSGINPTDPSAPSMCARTALNYPHVIAAKIGAQLTDVTCGGAQTKDFAGSQYPGVAPQLDALSGSTKLVTLTIGGNDNNTFIGAVLSCGSVGILTLGQGSPCKTLNGSTFNDQVDNGTYPAVKAALQAVKEKAPNARVAVLGYPWLLPAQADPSCFSKMPVAAGDVPYLRDLQTHLNGAVKRAADETGATYVDMSVVSEGHDGCQSGETRWIEPFLSGTGYVPVHPNAFGESRMAEQTLATLGLDN